MHIQSFFPLAIKFVDREAVADVPSTPEIRLLWGGFVSCLAQEEDKNWNNVGCGHSNIFRCFWKNLSLCGIAP